MKKTDQRLKIGLKYCGGCNPEYDRVKAVEQMAERLRGKAEFISPIGEDVDIILVVEGCATACADIGPFEGKEVRLLIGPDDVRKFITEMELYFERET